MSAKEKMLVETETSKEKDRKIENPLVTFFFTNFLNFSGEQENFLKFSKPVYVPAEDWQSFLELIDFISDINYKKYPKLTKSEKEKVIEILSYIEQDTNDLLAIFRQRWQHQEKKQKNCKCQSCATHVDRAKSKVEYWLEELCKVLKTQFVQKKQVEQRALTKYQPQSSHNHDDTAYE